MRRTRQGQEEGDLFAALAPPNETPAPAALIDSPLVAETGEWLRQRALTLGNLLSSERAAEYVAILRAFATLREGHEPEPLHEDVLREVCGEETSCEAETLFKSDIRQLKEWALVTERIEKERLRGYRDTRRRVRWKRSSRPKRANSVSRIST